MVRTRKFRQGLALESAHVELAAVLAVGYVRMSTPGQDDGYSRWFQREKICGVVDGLGARMPSKFLIEEVASGADRWRPGLKKVWDLIAESKTNGIRYFVTYDSDRLAREPLDSGLFLRHCKENGVKAYFADGSSVETFMDEVIQYLKGSFAREERVKIAKRTMDGKVSAAKANHMPNGVGVGRYGVHYDKDRKVWEIVEVEAVVVVMIFEWRLAGVSCSEISRRLNDMGIPSKTGLKWSPGVVRNILRNQAYTGSKWWGQKRHEMRYGEDEGPLRVITEKPKEEWILLEDFAPEIISPEIFHAVQAVMDSNPRRGENWDYLLGPFFVCGECGSSVCGSTQYWKGDIYPFYRCSGTVRGGEGGRICDMHGVRADMLEPRVFEYLKNAVRNPGEIVRGLERMAAEGGKEQKKRVSELQSKRERTRREVSVLTMQLTKGNIDQEMYESLVAPMNNFLGRLDSELAVLEEQIKGFSGWDRFEEQVSAALAKYRHSLETLDSEGLQKLMALLGVRITLMRGESGEKRVLVTGLLSPSLVTTAQTLA